MSLNKFNLNASGLNQVLVTFLCQVIKMICFVPHWRFQKALKAPALAQQRIFNKLIYGLSETEYGKYYGITEASNYQDFASKLPLQTYDELSSWIEKQLATNRPVLTPNPVIHVEPTSGSSGKRKRIPFTKPLMKAFGAMFCVWAYDHLSNGLNPKTGKLFISISPDMNKQALEGDAEFLGEPLRSILKPFLLLPPLHQNIESFQKSLALTLLNESDLEIISVWSPSYLLTILDYIQLNRQALASELPKSRKQYLSSEKVNWEKIWPKLKLISCWDNALAEPLANKLRQVFPNVLVQGKGLLATEAPLTVPLIKAKGCLPMLSDIFFEFEFSDGTIKRLSELKDGDEAQVILTQASGLTRYRLNDRVRVNGFYRSTPKLQFMGRAGQACDLAGEKLNEIFVRTTLLPYIPSGQFILVPYQNRQLGYVLIVEDNVELLEQSVEQALCESHHYGYARQTGQLQPIKIVRTCSLLQQLQAFYQSEGMLLGNIKETALITDPEKGERLLVFLKLGFDTILQPTVLA